MNPKIDKQMDFIRNYDLSRIPKTRWPTDFDLTSCLDSSQTAAGRTKWPLFTAFLSFYLVLLHVALSYINNKILSQTN